MKDLALTIGSDPEMFLLDTWKDKLVNAIPILKHDKTNPISLGDGIRMYSDNVLVETSFPPSSSKQGFVSRLGQAFKRMHHRLGSRFQLFPQTSYVFEEEEIGPKPVIMYGDLPVEWEIGCCPSVDVYSGIQRKPDPFSNGLRTGSFHIHIGNVHWQSGEDLRLVTMESKEEAIKILDIFLGCSSVIFDNDCTSQARRELYGKAGEFRPTDYGVEYRCLGNYALRSPILAELVYDLTTFAMSFIANESAGEILKSFDEILVRKAINNSDKGLAAAILANTGLPDKLWQRVQLTYRPDFIRDWNL